MSTIRTFAISAFLAIGVSLGAPVLASNNPAMDSDVARIGSEWARIKYQVHGRDDQYRQMDALSKQAAAVAAR